MIRPRPFVLARRQRGGQVDPGPLIELAHRRRERGDLLLNPRVQDGDIGGDRIHPGEHVPQQERVVVGDVAGERLLQHGDLLAHGVKGLKVLRTSPHTQTVGASGLAFNTVFCPADHPYVLGGGGEWGGIGGSGGPYIPNSIPLGTGGWEVDGQNTYTDASDNLTAFAICAK